MRTYKEQLHMHRSSYRPLASFTAYVVYLQHFQCFTPAAADTRSASSPSLRDMIKDPIKQYIIQPRDVFYFTKEPSSQPSIYPTDSSHPSFIPSPLPSNSQYPSASPTVLPSNQPTYSPSASISPSTIPSDVYSKNPSLQPVSLPPKEDHSYFNYGPYDDRFGPGRPSLQTYIYNETMIGNNSTMNHTKIMNYTKYSRNMWESVRNSLEYNYWSSFDMNRTLGNRCASDPWRKQSPIDVCPDVVNAECFEHHQTRNRGGDYDLNNTQMTLKILPSKLRIEYSRENSELDPSKLRPPHGDFAHNWNGYISAVHIDIKIPSEHTICGKKYAGEYQIYFYHPNRKQPVVQSVLIDIDPNDRNHNHFQRALNEWQAIHDARRMKCLDIDREERKLEETFVRRMKNILAASLDSHEVSLSDVHYRRVLEQRSMDDKQSTILDEPQDASDRFQNILQRVKERESHPTFDEEYEHLNLNANTLNDADMKSTVKPQYLRRKAIDTQNATSWKGTTLDGDERGDCQDSRESFFVKGENVTCDNIRSSSSIYSYCKNEINVKRLCPVACTLCHYTALRNIAETTTEASSPFPTPTNSPTSRVKWNPFQPRILNSIYFYGYDGSLTEPPCSEWVAWRVLDKPMHISTSQFNQMRQILFGQLDEECKKSSADWEGSVARPTQSLNNRPLWQCTNDDYTSDSEKRQGPVKDV